MSPKLTGPFGFQIGHLVRRTWVFSPLTLAVGIFDVSGRQEWLFGECINRDEKLSWIPTHITPYPKRILWVVFCWGFSCDLVPIDDNGSRQFRN